MISILGMGINIRAWRKGTRNLMRSYDNVEDKGVLNLHSIITYLDNSGTSKSVIKSKERDIWTLLVFFSIHVKSKLFTKKLVREWSKNFTPRQRE